MPIRNYCDICGESGKFARDHNAAPVLEYGRCCNRCNYRIVIPKRFELAIIARWGEK